MNFIIAECSPDTALDGYLFISKAFNAWQKDIQAKRVQSFAVMDQSRGAACLSLTLAGKGGVWATPITGAFGGFANNGRPAPTPLIDRLLDKALEWLRKEKAKRCTLRLPPGSFADPTSALLQNALFRNEWVLDQTDVNYHLDVQPPERFFASLGETKQKEIRRLKRADAAFYVLSHDQGANAYSIIARNREALGYPMTMTWDAIEELARAFPDVVKFYGVKMNDALIATAICLQVTNEYLYVFYWGEDPDYRKQSPIMLLAEGLMDHAYRHGFKTIDIGISTENSVPNPGLMAFKASLGCVATPKLTYRYDFS